MESQQTEKNLKRQIVIAQILLILSAMIIIIPGSKGNMICVAIGAALCIIFLTYSMVTRHRLSKLNRPPQGRQ